MLASYFGALSSAFAVQFSVSVLMLTLLVVVNVFVQRKPIVVVTNVKSVILSKNAILILMP
jgi:hypothetical protein